MATLNIGLARRGKPNLRPDEAIAAVRAIGGQPVLRSSLHDSDSEPTLIVETRRPVYASAAFEIAKRLGQDAIAQWDGRDGQLIGPAAAAWGTFNPAFFLTLDGSRLASADLRVAA